MAELLAAITELGVELPAPVAEAVCVELEALSAPSAAGTARVIAAVAQPATRERLLALLRAWQRERPEVSGAEIAWSLRSAVATDAWHRRHQQVELVWTGPAPVGTTLRRTDQALLEMIRGAKRSVVIVAFAAYRIPEIHHALVDASRRGVSLTFIAESLEDKVAIDPLLALGATLAERCAVYAWPLEQRDRDESGRHGTLHAKCAIVDDTSILISSANFTGHAMTLNIELGLLISGGDIPSRVSGHLALLQARGVFQPI